MSVISFEEAQNLVLNQYLQKLKDEIVSQFEVEKPLICTSSDSDPVPSNATFASIQAHGDQAAKEYMKCLMTENLSDVTVILKMYWEKSKSEEIQNDPSLSEELATRIAELIRRALFKAGVETFKKISSQNSPSWMILHEFMQTYEDGDPTRQQIWNYTKDHIQSITESEANVWVKYASEALLENQELVHTFIEGLQAPTWASWILFSGNS